MTDTPTPEESDARLRAAGPIGETFADVMAEQVAEGVHDPLRNLPAPFSAGQLDVDGIAALLPDLQRGLVDSIRASATAFRAERGTVVTPEDGYGLTRRLVHGQEVLEQAARVFASAARECAALVEEEAQTAVGDSDGILLGSYFVPDGAGQRIAVRADYAAGRSTWDLETLLGWLAETVTAEWAAEVDEPGGGHWQERDALAVARRALERLRSLASITPAVAKVEQARTRAAEAGDDATAAVLGQLRTIGDREYRGVKITREDSPKGRRS